MERSVFILMGISGSGKGTQGNLISEYLKKNSSEKEVFYVQTGSEIREFIKGESYTQRLAADIYNAGKLMPEFLTVQMWANLFSNSFKGHEHIVIDGTPRKLHEAGTLHSIFEFYNLPKAHVVHIGLSKEESLKRLLDRKRMDDNEEDIKERLSWYETHVVPAINFYKNNPHYNYIEINGEQSVEKVFSDIIEKVNEYKVKK